MVSAVVLSLDESIQQLKKEIIAQDWRLPQRRIKPLEEAFVRLKQTFKNQKDTLAILVMADNVIKYIKKYDITDDPDFIDFLKEAMAHVVTIYEEEEFSPEQEHQLFQRVYSQFGRLRQKLHASDKARVKPAPTSKGDIAPQKTVRANNDQPPGGTRRR